ncbi:hypothetical protein ACFLTY_03730 [Chloroflexota bacterium]
MLSERAQSREIIDILTKNGLFSACAKACVEKVPHQGGHIAIYSRAVEENPIDKPKEEGLWTVEESIEAVPGVWLKDILTDRKTNFNGHG